MLGPPADPPLEQSRTPLRRGDARRGRSSRRRGLCSHCGRRSRVFAPVPEWAAVWPGCGLCLGCCEVLELFAAIGRDGAELGDEAFVELVLSIRRSLRRLEDLLRREARLASAGGLDHEP